MNEIDFFMRSFDDLESQDFKDLEEKIMFIIAHSSLSDTLKESVRQDFYLSKLQKQVDKVINDAENLVKKQKAKVSAAKKKTLKVSSAK